MPKNILVIDDEELVIESLKKLLRREGYEVTIAESGKEALQKIKDINFDLIVSDIRMPGMDGIEIIKNIREYFMQKNMKQVPEIFITGVSSEESLRSAQELKVADYIYKPFDIVDFLNVVKRNLG